MTKELEVNDNPAPDQDRQPREESGDKRKEHNAQGEALQVNDNSAGAKSLLDHRHGEGPARNRTSRSFRARLSK